MIAKLYKFSKFFYLERKESPMSNKPIIITFLLVICQLNSFGQKVNNWKNKSCSELPSPNTKNFDWEKTIKYDRCGEYHLMKSDFQDYSDKLLSKLIPTIKETRKANYFSYNLLKRCRDDAGNLTINRLKSNLFNYDSTDIFNDIVFYNDQLLRTVLNDNNLVELSFILDKILESKENQGLFCNNSIFYKRISNSIMNGNYSNYELSFLDNIVAQLENKLKKTDNICINIQKLISNLKAFSESHVSRVYKQDLEFCLNNNEYNEDDTKRIFNSISSEIDSLFFNQKSNNKTESLVNFEIEMETLIDKKLSTNSISSIELRNQIWEFYKSLIFLYWYKMRLNDVDLYYTSKYFNTTKLKENLNGSTIMNNFSVLSESFIEERELIKNHKKLFKSRKNKISLYHRELDLINYTYYEYIRVDTPDKGIHFVTNRNSIPVRFRKLLMFDPTILDIQNFTFTEFQLGMNLDQHSIGNSIIHYLNFVSNYELMEIYELFSYYEIEQIEEFICRSQLYNISNEIPIAINLNISSSNNCFLNISSNVPSSEYREMVNDINNHLCNRFQVFNDDEYKNQIEDLKYNVNALPIKCKVDKKLNQHRLTRSSSLPHLHKNTSVEDFTRKEASNLEGKIAFKNNMIASSQNGIRLIDEFMSKNEVLNFDHNETVESLKPVSFIANTDLSKCAGLYLFETESSSKLLVIEIDSHAVLTKFSKEILRINNDYPNFFTNNYLDLLTLTQSSELSLREYINYIWNDHGQRGERTKIILANGFNDSKFVHFSYLSSLMNNPIWISNLYFRQILFDASFIYNINSSFVNDNGQYSDLDEFFINQIYSADSLLLLESQNILTTLITSFDHDFNRTTQNWDDRREEWQIFASSSEDGGNIVIIPIPSDEKVKMLSVILFGNFELKFGGNDFRGIKYDLKDYDKIINN